MPRKVRHQIQIKRQLLRSEFFKQREDVAALAGGNEVVGIFDAGGNAVQIDQRADRILFEPERKFIRRDGGEN